MAFAQHHFFLAALSLVVAAAVAGCTSEIGGSDDRSDGGAGDGGDGDSDGTESDWLFTSDRIIDISVEISDADIEELRLEDQRSDPRRWVSADVVIDDHELADVGVRLRGKFGSFTGPDEKPKLRFDFNRNVPGRRFFGLESLSLNNGKQDCGLLREPAGYAVLSGLGLPETRTGIVRLTFNGVDYGLYVNVETQDDRFLKRNYPGNSGGQLYDGKYLYDIDNMISKVELVPDRLDAFGIDEGDKDSDRADLRGLIEAIDDHGGLASFYDEVGKHLHWANFHRVWAASHWLSHRDSYFGNANNYRIYFDPSDGLAEFLPSDLDSVMETEQDRIRGLLAELCRDDSTCWSEQKRVADGVFDEIDALDVPALIAAWNDLTTGKYQGSRLEDCNDDLAAQERVEVREWPVGRSAQARLNWDI